MICVAPVFASFDSSMAVPLSRLLRIACLEFNPSISCAPLVTALSLRRAVDPHSPVVALADCCLIQLSISERENRHAPPNLNAGSFFGRSQPVDRAFRDLEIPRNLQDRQDVGISYSHWRKTAIDDKIGNRWQYRSPAGRRSQWLLIWTYWKTKRNLRLLRGFAEECVQAVCNHPSALSKKALVVGNLQQTLFYRNSLRVKRLLAMLFNQRR